MLEDHFHSAVISAKQTILWKQVYPFILAESSGGTPLGLIQGSHCRIGSSPVLSVVYQQKCPTKGLELELQADQTPVTLLLHLAMRRGVGHLASVISPLSSVILRLEER